MRRVYRHTSPQALSSCGTEKLIAAPGSGVSQYNGIFVSSCLAIVLQLALANGAISIRFHNTLGRVSIFWVLFQQLTCPFRKIHYRGISCC